VSKRLSFPLAVAALMSGVATAPGVSGSASGRPSRVIAFATASYTHGLPPDVWTIGTDGKQTHRMHVPVPVVDSPMWAPDGRKFVLTFSKTRGGDPNDIAVVPVDTPIRTVRRLATQVGGGQPTWSPDGRWIAFVGQFGKRPARQAVYVMRPEGSDLRRVTVESDYYSDIAWAPDSKHLVAVRDDSDPQCFAGSLVLANIANAHSTALETCGFQPTWSPDGHLIVYASDLSGLRTIRPDGGGEQQLTDGFDFLPAFSPDGLHLVFMRQARDPTNARWLVTRDLRTGHERAITPRWQQFVTHVLNWSPDGEMILFGRRYDTIPPGVCSLWVVNHDGSRLRRLVTGTTCLASWKP
jgi:Tol biopolymer transport system component